MRKYLFSLIIRFANILAVLMVLLFTLPSLASDDRDSKHLDVGFTFDVDFSLFQPELLTFTQYIEIVGQIFMPLAYQKQDGTMLPGAAKSWDWNEQRTSVVFHLDPRLKWSNGDALTAHDFVFTFKKMAYHKNTHVLGLMNILGWDEWFKGNFDAEFGAEALSDYDLKLTFPKSVRENFLQFQLFYATKQAGSETLKALMLPWSKIDKWTSNGAFKITEITPKNIILEKNTYFPDEDKIDITEAKYSSATHRDWLEKYIKGDFSALVGSIGNQKRWVQENLKNNLHKVGLPIVYFMTPDPRAGVFKELNLLNALYLALDREKFGRRQFGSSYKSIIGNIPSVFASYQPIEKTKVSFSKQLELAKSYMEKLGYGKDNRLKLTVGVVKEIPGYSKVAGFAKGSWQSIYVDLELVPMNNYMDMVHGLRDQKTDLIVSTFTGTYADPLAYLELPIEFLNLAEIKLDDDYYKLRSGIQLANNQAEYKSRTAKLDKYISDKKMLFPIAIDDATVLIQPPLNDDGSATVLVSPKILIKNLKLKTDTNISN